MSTYSPNLRIELISTGDQAGTWGTTTNSNLGTLIESAISGYVSVSIVSAKQALTALNGVEDQSRNASIALTTVTSLDFEVYIPAAEKQYVFYNATSYNATIYNSTITGNTIAAGGGVTIPGGKTVSVWSDGTSVFLQNTSVPTQPFGMSDTSPASTAFVQAALKALYPIGTIYTNATNGTNPAAIFGFGTWVAFGAGRVPVGYDASNALFDAAEETGGSYDATLVSHTHTGTTGTESVGHTHDFSGSTSTTGAHQHIVDYPRDCGTWGQFGQTSAIGSDVFCDSNGYQANAALSSSTGNHSHSVSGTTGGVSANHTHSFTTASSGSSATNANIQPYITVYMWKRTA